MRKAVLLIFLLLAQSIWASGYAGQLAASQTPFNHTSMSSTMASPNMPSMDGDCDDHQMAHACQILCATIGCAYTVASDFPLTLAIVAAKPSDSYRLTLAMIAPSSPYRPPR